MKVKMSAGLVAVMLAGACGGGSTPTNPAPPVGNAPSVSVAIDGDAYRPGGSAAFVPGSVTVAVGTLVNWQNRDQTDHNVTAKNGSFSGTLNGGGNFSRAFPTRGTVEYRCTIHPSMEGTIIVQ